MLPAAGALEFSCPEALNWQGRPPGSCLCCGCKEITIKGVWLPAGGLIFCPRFRKGEEG